MATTIKGGTLILDFKEENLISDVRENPSKLKGNFFDKLERCNGKNVKLINLADEDDFIVRSDTINGVKVGFFISNNKKTYSLSFTSINSFIDLYINEDNYAYFSISEI